MQQGRTYLQLKVVYHHGILLLGVHPAEHLLVSMHKTVDLLSGDSLAEEIDVGRNSISVGF